VKLILMKPKSTCGETEAIELEYGDSLKRRSNCILSAKGLGPPDLCHLTKTIETQSSLIKATSVQQSIVGTYHHIVGLAYKNPADVAAYITSLVNEQQKTTVTVSSKSFWKIQKAIYCKIVYLYLTISNEHILKQPKRSSNKF
jgi:hypothetical protein